MKSGITYRGWSSRGCLLAASFGFLGVNTCNQIAFVQSFVVPTSVPNFRTRQRNPKPKLRVLPRTNHFLQLKAPPSSSSYLSPPPLSSLVNIREWQPGDGSDIYEFLQQQQPKQNKEFDPEGSLYLDCRSEELLQESYNPSDGCCFLVAELTTGSGQESDDDNEMKNILIGTAGMIVGTPIQYQTSGASLSAPEKLAAAIRRCLVATTTNNVSSQDILKQLLTNLEERAKQAKATELIGLAYPQTSSKPLLGAGEKPTPELLEELGYKPLPQQLPVVDVIQYGKILPSETTTIVSTIMSNQEMPRPDTTSSPLTSNPNTVQSEMIATGLLTTISISLLLVAWFVIAQFMGLDTTVMEQPGGYDRSTSSINRGLGRPLSTDDLSQLLLDEQLQRKTLDDDESDSNGSSKSRDWNELTVEERREELALLRVIQGEDIRVVK